MTNAMFRMMPSSSVRSEAIGGRADGLDSIIDRLIDTIQKENDAIEARMPVDYREFNLKKSQGLLELSRLLPTLQLSSVGTSTKQLILSLKNTLEWNEKLLATQLRAARRITDIVAKAIQEGQSDGTYSAHAWRYQDE